MTSAEKLAKKVDDFSDNLDENIESGLHNGMQKTEKDTKTNIKENDSDVHGNLLDSIVLNRDTIPTFEHSRSVRINEHYAPFVEYGTGSMQDGGPLKFPAPDERPPIGKIRQWIIRKGLKPTNSDMKTRNLVQRETFTDSQGNTEIIYPQQEQLAWAIATQIGTYGNRPHPFARPAAHNGLPITKNNVKRGMKRSVRRF